MHDDGGGQVATERRTACLLMLAANRLVQRAENRSSFCEWLRWTALHKQVVTERRTACLLMRDVNNCVFIGDGGGGLRESLQSCLRRALSRIRQASPTPPAP